MATATLLNQDARPILPSFQSKRYRLMSTVMIAEDDLLMADMLEDVLVAGGYEVCGIARTVKEGIELGDRCKPDLAVLDIRLADGGLGMDIAARLHSRDGVGILYASGNSSHMGLTKDDGEALLRKPYRAGDVVRALKIVEQIVRTGEASQPFPRGFSVLSDSSPKSGTLSDSSRSSGRRDQTTSSTAGGACGRIRRMVQRFARNPPRQRHNRGSAGHHRPRY